MNPPRRIIEKMYHPLFRFWTHPTIQYPTSVGSSQGFSGEGFLYPRRDGVSLPRNHQGMRIHAGTSLSTSSGSAECHDSQQCTTLLYGEITVEGL